jgi:hypothetical protein
MIEIWFVWKPEILIFSHHVEGSAAHPTLNPMLSELLYLRPKQLETEVDYMPQINIKTKTIIKLALCFYFLLPGPI